MTFQLSRGTESTYWNGPGNPIAPWVVEKVLRGGENHLIASFIEREDAEKCLNSLRPSMECQRGAQVTEAF